MKYKLEDIVDVTMGQSPKSEYYNTEGKGYPFLQGNRTFGFKYPTFDTYTTVMTKPAKAGDVIMSVRAPVGDLNITPVNMCLGRGVCSLRMKNGKLSRRLNQYVVCKFICTRIPRRGEQCSPKSSLNECGNTLCSPAE